MANLAIANLALAKFASTMLFEDMLFQDVGFGELARESWGNQGKREPREPRGAAIWSLHMTRRVRTPLALKKLS